MSETPTPGLHVGVIMDGNGRWAEARGQRRTAGHRAGAEATRRIVEAAPALGVSALTLYAFSGDNWRRPRREVAAIMGLLAAYLAHEAPRLAAADVRLSVVGRRDRLPGAVLAAVEAAEAATRWGEALHLRVAVDYSARDMIVAAAARWGAGASREAFESALLQATGGACRQAGAVDLLVRTGGEQRLSDFLLWECAYAELVFSPRPWPDFGPADLAGAIADFRRRDRRFGGLPAVRDCIP
jgi:undecaprenyl diphosphate synthase